MAGPAPVYFIGFPVLFLAVCGSNTEGGGERDDGEKKNEERGGESGVGKGMRDGGEDASGPGKIFRPRMGGGVSCLESSFHVLVLLRRPF